MATDLQRGIQVGKQQSHGRLLTIESKFIGDDELSEPLNILIGRDVVACNLITPAFNVKYKEESSSKKTSGGTTNYYASLACVVATGQIDGIYKIWKDNDTYYEVSTSQGFMTFQDNNETPTYYRSPYGGKFAVYSGSNNQNINKVLDALSIVIKKDEFNGSVIIALDPNGVGVTSDGSYSKHLSRLNTPAYKNIAYALFVDMPLGSSPKIPKLKMEVRCNPHTWETDFANYTGYDSTKLNNSTYDVNPVAIVYEILRNTQWGCAGFETTEIDKDSFLAAYNQAYSDSIFISVLLDSQNTIRDTLAQILNYVDGYLCRTSDGKIAIKLVKDPANTNTLKTINNTNLIEEPSVTTSSDSNTWAKTIITYSDRTNDYEDAVESYESPLYESINNIRPVKKQTLKYIKEQSVARILTKRIATGGAKPESIISCKVLNNATYNVGELCYLNYPAGHINNILFRITSVTYSESADNTIDIEGTVHHTKEIDVTDNMLTTSIKYLTSKNLSTKTDPIFRPALIPWDIGDPTQSSYKPTRPAIFVESIDDQNLSTCVAYYHTTFQAKSGDEKGVQTRSIDNECSAKFQCKCQIQSCAVLASSTNLSNYVAQIEISLATNNANNQSLFSTLKNSSKPLYIATLAWTYNTSKEQWEQSLLPIILQVTSITIFSSSHVLTCKNSSYLAGKYNVTHAVPSVNYRPSPVAYLFNEDNAPEYRNQGEFPFVAIDDLWHYYGVGVCRGYRAKPTQTESDDYSKEYNPGLFGYIDNTLSNNNPISNGYFANNSNFEFSANDDDETSVVAAIRNAKIRFFNADKSVKLVTSGDSISYTTAENYDSMGVHVSTKTDGQIVNNDWVYLNITSPWGTAPIETTGYSNTDVSGSSNTPPELDDDIDISQNGTSNANLDGLTAHTHLTAGTVTTSGTIVHSYATDDRFTIVASDNSIILTLPSLDSCREGDRLQFSLVNLSNATYCTATITDGTTNTVFGNGQTLTAQVIRVNNVLQWTFFRNFLVINN